MQKLKVGFFGGCFNPPTNIHIGLAENLIKENVLDKVIFVPVGNYYSKKDLTDVNYRYQMLKIATLNKKNIEIEDITLNFTEKLYATDTFKLIYEKYYKIYDIYFIMGSDNFDKMSTWKDYCNLRKKYKYIILDRKEDISSTDIRNKIRNGEDVNNYLNKDVIEYIQKHKIF